MLMNVNVSIEGQAKPGKPALRHPRLVANLAATVLILVWMAVSVCLIQGPVTWLTTPEYSLHLAVNLVCMGVCVAYAGRLHGGLDEKVVQALLASVIVFGLFAFAILAGRLFFSRSMLILSVSGAALASTLVVLIRHKLSARRVAVVAPLLGDYRSPPQLGHVIHDPSADLRRFDIVLVSFAEPVSAEWSKALSRAMLAGCKVRHIGEYLEELRGTVSIEHFELDHLPVNGISSYQALKRALDIALVIFLLPVALPVLAAASLLVAVSMGRPVLFRQERIGLGGKPFIIVKLRTMRPARSGEVGAAAAIGDSRVTPLGRFFRRVRIDELPQLWNVLNGDMSLIGPRPEQPALTETYVREMPAFAYRHLVRPGITGWAQVCSGYAADLEETRTKLTFDLYYIKKLSLYLDLLIVMRTFWTLATGSGAR